MGLYESVVEQGTTTCFWFLNDWELQQKLSSLYGSKALFDCLLTLCQCCKTGSFVAVY